MFFSQHDIRLVAVSHHRDKKGQDKDISKSQSDGGKKMCYDIRSRVLRSGPCVFGEQRAEAEASQKWAAEVDRLCKGE